jgi:1-deoxy-D-xylulose 5-phosphate reductoisomerase
VIEAVLEQHVNRPAQALAAVLEADRWAREVSDKMLAGPAVAGA